VRRRAALALGLLATGLVLGCAIGPDYERPDVAKPAEYRGLIGPAEAASIADLPWWEVFEDAALRELIEVALENNLDLRKAVARVERASEGVGIARSELFPQVGGQAGATRQQSAVVDPTDNRKFNVFFGAFNAAWELDVWGRIRRSTEAAQANFLATDEIRRGVLLSLVSGVAGSYFDLLGLDLELQVANENVVSFQETLDYFSRRHQGGVGSRLQVTRAEAALAQVAASVPRIESDIIARENQIAVLLGRPPGAIPRGSALAEQALPPHTPAGLPSDLLERRPDVRAAEERVVEANALVGVAVANFLPRIGLTALWGGASTELNQVSDPRSRVWDYGADLTTPLFQGGRLLAERRAQIAFWEETVADYQNTLLNAFADVSNALTLQQKLAEARVQRVREVDALVESVRLSLIRYERGLASYYEVLEAQQQLFPAQISLARVRTDEFLALVALYRSLGGGWQLGTSWMPPKP
jgi:multidrug efflux system outer membrane protein